MINVLWMHSDFTGCGVYRCYTPALTLEQQGFDNHFLLHKNTPNEGFGDLGDMHVAVFQRAVGTLFLDWIKECRRRGVVTVFELDDDLFHVAKQNPSGPFWNNKKIQRLLAAQLDLVDHIVVSTEPLRDIVREETGRHVNDFTVAFNHLHPTTWGSQIFDGQARYANLSAGSPVQVIGWQGSNTHDRDFAEAIPALKQIIQERPNVILRFFGNVPLSCRGHIPENRFQWTRGVAFHMYPSTLYYVNFDIGLAPITDTKFNRSKSNLKWLEYSAVGTPCVASRVYPYARSIEHGVTGYVAGSTQEWYDALTALLDSRELRQQIGAAAQRHVWEKWGPVRANAWADLFRRLAGEDHGDQHRNPDSRLDGTAGATQEAV